MENKNKLEGWEYLGNVELFNKPDLNGNASKYGIGELYIKEIYGIKRYIVKTAMECFHVERTGKKPFTHTVAGVLFEFDEGKEK